ncbi:unnamed protein product [Enterobius vermicularis]|uniref:tRNA (guanine(26)-N(2))-dimethyltransferase n=1 Tax=Enterobius vermicularis TaxID=51028 RepID=A0A0N4V5U7_ENTVE|nr:unnamed protein product [Enterobius vermicularis]
MTTLSEGVRILDALSASGLRALRFAKEIPNVLEVVANDFSENAVEAVKQNIVLNGLEGLVKPNFGDAIEVMMSHRALDKRFHAIDLDPYGSASVFLDAAVQAVADQGILMVTCTDMAVLCGNTPESCYNKYGSVGLRHKCCHEFAIRVLLKALDSHANRYARYIEPLLSLSIDFYVRVFVRLHTSAHHAKDSITKAANVLACVGCHSLQLQPLAKKVVSGASVKYTASMVDSGLLDGNGKCIHCGQSVHFAGPIYSAPIHQLSFVNSLITRLRSIEAEENLATYNRLLGVLTVIAEELQDVPLYYENDQLWHIIKSPVPKSLLVRSAILNAGYRCSISHCNPKAIKTDAPLDFLWDIVRTVVCYLTSLVDIINSGTVLPLILCINSLAFLSVSFFLACDLKQKDIGHSDSFFIYTDFLKHHCLLRTFSFCERHICLRHEVDLRTNSEAQARSKTDGLLRFQCNRGKNWGPKNKAKGSINSVKAGFFASVEKDGCVASSESH